VSSDDFRYFDFQLWQEGVARYVEYATLQQAASRRAGAAFRSLPDYEPYASALQRRQQALRQELDSLVLGENRRVAFYPIGAAIALLLDRVRPDWKREYARRPFQLAGLLHP
jgi:hypothetical protein